MVASEAAENRNNTGSTQVEAALHLAIAFQGDRGWQLNDPGNAIPLVSSGSRSGERLSIATAGIPGSPHPVRRGGCSQE